MTRYPQLNYLGSPWYRPSSSAPRAAPFGGTPFASPLAALLPGAVHVVRPPRFGEFRKRALPSSSRELVAMMAISSPQYVWTLFLRYFLHTARRRRGRRCRSPSRCLVVLQTVFTPVRISLDVRTVRTPTAGRVGRGADRARLGAVGAGLRPDPAVPDLWRPLRNRHRHRLSRRRRPDGALGSRIGAASRSAWSPPATAWAR